MDRDLVVTVLFDFEYHGSDGQRVYMHKDEEFLVIQQTNSDWWQVIRSGERKPFYAPTQYLKLQPRPRPQLPPKVKQVKQNPRDSRRAPLSISDAERHITGEDVSPSPSDSGAVGRRRCNSLEDAAAGSSSVETLDDSPPGPERVPPTAGTPETPGVPEEAATPTGTPAGTLAGTPQIEVTPSRAPAPRMPPARHRRPRISKDLWSRRKSWSVDERSRTWELVRPETAPPPAAATSTASLDGRHRATEKWAEKTGKGGKPVAVARTKMADGVMAGATAGAMGGTTSGSPVAAVRMVTGTDSDVRVRTGTDTDAEARIVTGLGATVATETVPISVITPASRATAGTGMDPRPPRAAERPVPTPRPTLEATDRRPVPPSAASKPPPPVPTPVVTVPAATAAAIAAASMVASSAATSTANSAAVSTIAPVTVVAKDVVATGVSDSVEKDGRTGVGGMTVPVLGGSESGIGQRRQMMGGLSEMEQAKSVEVSERSVTRVNDKSVTRVSVDRGMPESKRKAEKPRPVEGKPRPVEGKPRPVEGKPRPVEGKPRPVEEKPRSVEEKVRPAEEKPRRPGPRRVDASSVGNSNISSRATEGQSQDVVSGQVTVESVNQISPRRVMGDISSEANPRRVSMDSAEGAGPRRTSLEDVTQRRVPVDNIETLGPRRMTADGTEVAGLRRPAPEHGRFKQEVLKLITRSRKEDRRTSDETASKNRPPVDVWDRSSAKQDVKPVPPSAAQKRPTTLERETLTGSGSNARLVSEPRSGAIVKSASADLSQASLPIEQTLISERAVSGPRPDILPSNPNTNSPPSLLRQTSYDRSLQSFSTFSNLRSARIDLAGHNASFKRTAERLRRPAERERPRKPTSARQVDPPRVDGPPKPPVPPKTLQLRLHSTSESQTTGQTSVPTTPDDADWSDSEPAGSESESGSWERLDQMRAALCFANPLMPRSGLSRSADHLPVPLPRTRLNEISPPQSRQPPPVPHILEAPIRSLADGWGEYLHRGRKYYYNVDTQSSTWKPPRRNVKSPSVSPGKASDTARPSTEPITPVLEVDIPLVPLPPGWRRRVDSTGELCYVRDSSPTRWYSNQNEDDHVYFFKEGSNSSTWTLPPAENGAGQTAKEAESVSGRQVPVGGVPSVLQVARGQRGRSLVFPPPPTTEPPPPQLISGNQTHVILNQGTLNHTKLAKETSWRARKSWAPCRVVLTDRSLFLFKDTRGNAGMPPQWGRTGHRPDTAVDLAGAFVDWDSEASSRKNVFQIRTVRGLRLLLQDDDALTASHWYDAIKRAIASVPSSTNQLAAPRGQLTAEDRLTRSRSVRFTAGPGSQEDLSRDNSTIRDRLRRFFRARPPADSLVSRGILKDEPVFGGHLAALCAIEGSTVPRFVTECICAIEAKPEHMKMDGVYRASGNLSQVQRIRCEVDQDNYQVLYDEEDVHVLTGALKLFFRELKEPLVPFSVLPEALRVAGLTVRSDQVSGFRRMVCGLPVVNRETLRVLLAHLCRVTELQEFNRMHAHNLAIVFGPTLMWPEQDSPDLALDLMRQNRAVEALLELRTEVFEPV